MGKPRKRSRDRRGPIQVVLALPTTLYDTTSGVETAGTACIERAALKIV